MTWASVPGALTSNYVLASRQGIKQITNEDSSWERTSGFMLSIPDFDHGGKHMISCQLIKLDKDLLHQTQDKRMGNRQRTARIVTRPPIGCLLHHPRSRGFQHLEQLPFVAVCFRTDIATILPSRDLRQAHQDALNTGTGCHEAKLCSAVVYEIELDVATTAEELPPALSIRAG